jgi:predicted small lipoprotein YifL
MRGKAIILLLLVAISGCGKKGPLDVPPGGSEDVRVEREWNKDREKEQSTR